MTASAGLSDRLNAREAVVGVIGLGYVGLPLALAFVEAGFKTLGFDVDPEKIAALESGRCYIDHLDTGTLAPAVKNQTFQPSTDFARLGEADALVICVPTPLGRHLDPNLSFVESTARQIARRLRRGQLVVLESTTYPGTTDEVLRPLLEESGLVCSRDFFLAFSPEREDPGNRRFKNNDIPKVIGAVDEVSATFAEELYRGVFAATVRLSSARAAEATKLTENIFRAVNIALVNELKVVYDAMGIDVWEVLDAASTKPFGFMRFDPGPGWGGHCIPVDPFYLAWKAREFGLRTRFIELAGEVNVEMPKYVITKLQAALNERRRPLKDSSILILGIAYKPDVADPRESPAFELLDLLVAHGAQVSYHDPHVPQCPSMRTWPDLPPLESVPLERPVLQAADAVVVVTHHAAIDFELVRRHARLVIDTRGIYREPADNVVRA